MNVKTALALATTALALGLAPSAFAQDFCVNDQACLDAGGTEKLTLEDALAAANATAPVDRILMGPGIYKAQSKAGFKSELNPVEIIGSGSGSTILTGPTDTNIVLYLNHDSRASDVGVVIPENAATYSVTGMYLDGAVAERVEVTADPAVSGVGIGIRPGGGAVVQDSEVDLTMAEAISTGVSAYADSTVRRSALAADTGLATQGSHVHADRLLIRSSSTGIHVINSATDIEATNSVIQTTDNAVGVYASTANNTDAGIALRGDTIVGDGTPGSIGVLAGSNKALAASVSVDSSIVRGFANSLKSVASVVGGSADVSTQYSDYDPATAGTSGTGTLTPGAGNINADPLFIGSPDFHLLAGSPLLDAGNPADLGDVGDFDGNTRVTDADGDGIARRDIGAFEAPAAPEPPVQDPPVQDPPVEGGDPAPTGETGATTPPPSGDPAAADPAPATGDTSSGTAGSGESTAPVVDRVPPALTNLRIRNGRLGFRLSEAATIRVIVKKRSARGALRSARTVKRSFAAGARTLRIGTKLSHGSYVALVTATDATGNASRSYRLRFSA